MCRNANGLPALMEYESPENGSEGAPEDAMVEDEACIVHSVSDEVKRLRILECFILRYHSYDMDSAYCSFM